MTLRIGDTALTLTTKKIYPQGWKAPKPSIRIVPQPVS